MDDFESDEHFITYVDLHSRTERALFHRDHVLRFCSLANAVIVGDLPVFVAMHHYDIADQLKAARDRLSGAGGAG